MFFKEVIGSNLEDNLEDSVYKLFDYCWYISLGMMEKRKGRRERSSAPLAAKDPPLTGGAIRNVTSYKLTPSSTAQ